jgi:hypothetical protein
MEIIYIFFNQTNDVNILFLNKQIIGKYYVSEFSSDSHR